MTEKRLQSELTVLTGVVSRVYPGAVLFSFLVHHYHRILPHLLQMTKVAPKAKSQSGCLGIPLAIIPSKSEMVVATPVF